MNHHVHVDHIESSICIYVNYDHYIYMGNVVRMSRGVGNKVCAVRIRLLPSLYLGNRYDVNGHSLFKD